jgi:hypothetical protein
MATATEWSIGYARQARADLGTWAELEFSTLPDCQRLHFLQMACEKLSKAHLCAGGTDPRTLQSSHGYIARQLPLIVRRQLESDRMKPGLIRDVVMATRAIAREIELLAPAIDDGGRRPDNSEYPWEDDTGRLWVPADYTFPIEFLLQQRHGRTILKIIRRAVYDLAD